MPQRLWLSRQMWQRRLVFWGGAVVIGIVAVLFALAADGSRRLFEFAIQTAPWLPLFLTPAGFLLSAYAAARWFPGSQGSGIQQAIAAMHLRDSAAAGRLLAPRIVVGKIGLTLLGLACGASIGREGPTVQIGAAIMLRAGRMGGLGRARVLILAGSAAGISAAFNTPIAGIVFAIEEMARSFEARTTGFVVTAVVIAGLVSLALVGRYDYFGTAAGNVAGLGGWLMVVACGIGGGVLGALFSSLMLLGVREVRRRISGRSLRRPLALAGLCGLCVAAIGMASGGMTFGTGYEFAKHAMEGTPLPWYFVPAKLAATLLSSISGIPGGIFAPSLSIGAGFGSVLATLSGTAVAPAALLGMAGYFAGAVQAPITAFVIVLEMTADTRDVIPVMCVALIGHAVARLLTTESLYHGLAKAFLKPEPRLPA